MQSELVKKTPPGVSLMPQCDTMHCAFDAKKLAINSAIDWKSK